jgi:hypothetical protein
MSGEPPTPSLTTRPFNYEARDFLALSRHAVQWWQVALSAVFAVGLVYFFGSLMIETGFDWLLAALTLLILVIFAGPWTWRPLLTFWAAKREGYGPHEFEIEPEALRYSSTRSSAKFGWSGLQRLHRTRDRLFIFSSKAVAFMIPRRAFESDADFEHFIATAQARWDEHH